MPKYKVDIQNHPATVKKIEVDIKERIKSIIKPIDHTFSLSNYEYILKDF